MGSKLMEDIKNQIEENEKKIKEIENSKNLFIDDYFKEKREFFKIVRGDFLTGGIIASSLFLILSSLINFFGINFPFDLLIGIFGCIIGMCILIAPVARPKFTISKSNNRILNIVSDFQKMVCQKATIIEYDFRRLISKDISNTSITSVKDLNTFQDKLYNLYKEGVEGLNQLKEHSPEIILKKISKINQKYVETFEKVHDSIVFEKMLLEYIHMQTIKGEKLEPEDRHKIRNELFEKYEKYIKLFQSKFKNKKLFT